MRCPFCGEENTRVVDSRPAEDGSSIRRRRQCDACSRRFTTYEKVETIPLLVVKKDESRVPYERSKIESGVLRACHKRPVSSAQIEKLIDEVETALFQSGVAEVKTTFIGELVMERLKCLDQVAYARFASVYREFKDVRTFMVELRKLSGEEGHA